MDWRQRKRESDGERERYRCREREKARALFCCEHSESPAGGAALTICQRSHAYFPGPPRSSTAVTSTRLTKPRDKSFTPTPSLLTLLIYPACLWLLPPHRQQLLSRALFFSLLNSSFPITEILSNGNIISVLYFILFNFSLKLCLTYLAAF